VEGLRKKKKKEEGEEKEQEEEKEEEKDQNGNYVAYGRTLTIISFLPSLSPYST
jgi:uncharacterized Zn ribbon protein